MPLIVDYKTDDLSAAGPVAQAGRYRLQRDLYAVAVADARDAPAVEVAYVFLEPEEEPVVRTMDREAIEAGRREIEARVSRLAAAEDAR